MEGNFFKKHTLERKIKILMKMYTYVEVLYLNALKSAKLLIYFKSHN